MDALHPFRYLCLCNGSGIHSRSPNGRVDEDLEHGRRHVKAVLEMSEVLVVCVCYGEFDFTSFWETFMKGKSFPRIFDMRCVTFTSREDIEEILKVTWELDFDVRFHFYSCMVANEEGESKSLVEAINGQRSLLVVDRRVITEDLVGTVEQVFGSKNFFMGRREGVVEDFCTMVRNLSQQPHNHKPDDLFSKGIMDKSDLSMCTKGSLAEMHHRSIALCTIGAGIRSRFSGWDDWVSKAAAAAQKAMEAAAIEAAPVTTPIPKSSEVDTRAKSRKRSRIEEE